MNNVSEIMLVVASLIEFMIAPNLIFESQLYVYNGPRNGPGNLKEILISYLNMI